MFEADYCRNVLNLSSYHSNSQIMLLIMGSEGKITILNCNPFRIAQNQGPYEFEDSWNDEERLNYVHWWCKVLNLVYFQSSINLFANFFVWYLVYMILLIIQYLKANVKIIQYLNYPLYLIKFRLIQNIFVIILVGKKELTFSKQSNIKDLFSLLWIVQSFIN